MYLRLYVSTYVVSIYVVTIYVASILYYVVSMSYLSVYVVLIYLCCICVLSIYLSFLITYDWNNNPYSLKQAQAFQAIRAKNSDGLLNNASQDGGATFSHLLCDFKVTTSSTDVIIGNRCCQQDQLTQSVL